MELFTSAVVVTPSSIWSHSLGIWVPCIKSRGRHTLRACFSAVVLIGQSGYGVKIRAVRYSHYSQAMNLCLISHGCRETGTTTTTSTTDNDNDHQKRFWMYYCPLFLLWKRERNMNSFLFGIDSPSLNKERKERKTSGWLKTNLRSN